MSLLFQSSFFEGVAEVGVEGFSNFVCAIFWRFGLEPVGSLVLHGGFFYFGGGLLNYVIFFDLPYYFLYFFIGCGWKKLYNKKESKVQFACSRSPSRFLSLRLVPCPLNK